MFDRVRRIDVAGLRAAWWTLRATHAARLGLRRNQITAVVLPPPPPVGASGTRGVDAILRRRNDTCLVRAIVRQAWMASQGRAVDLIVGVTSPSEFQAHAWLDGDPLAGDHYVELTRYPAHRRAVE